MRCWRDAAVVLEVGQVALLGDDGEQGHGPGVVRLARRPEVEDFVVDEGERVGVRDQGLEECRRDVVGAGRLAALHAADGLNWPCALGRAWADNCTYVHS